MDYLQENHSNLVYQNKPKNKNNNLKKNNNKNQQNKITFLQI